MLSNILKVELKPFDVELVFNEFPDFKLKCV